MEKGFVTANVAMRLRKPARGEPRRRGVTAEEAALIRRLARQGRDPILDELTMALPERLGLRRKVAIPLIIVGIGVAMTIVAVLVLPDPTRTAPPRYP